MQIQGGEGRVQNEQHARKKKPGKKRNKSGNKAKSRKMAKGPSPEWGIGV